MAGPNLKRPRRASEGENGTLEGSRTPNLLIRSQALYPIELRVLIRVAGL